MKRSISWGFRDSHGPVTFRLRPTFDLRSARSAFKFKRRCECAKMVPSQWRAQDIPPC